MVALNPNPLVGEGDRENLRPQSFFDVTSNKSDDFIVGNDGDNILSGKEGNDDLEGGTGADKFVFDIKLNATINIDTIEDFVSGSDAIYLSKKIFSKYKKDADLSDDFVSEDGVTAYYATGRFLYDTTTGVLSYDADGDGLKMPVQFATLTGAPDLVASDLHIF